MKLIDQAGAPVPRPVTKWDHRFLALAQHVAAWSKDPSTKVGAVLTQGKHVLSLGYNGFPAGVSDHADLLADRTEKLARTVHAEMNAVLNCTIAQPWLGSTLYTWPFQPCERCAVHLIQANIARVVAPRPNAAQLDRWGVEFRLAQSLFREAGVEFVDVSDL